MTKMSRLPNYETVADIPPCEWCSEPVTQNDTLAYAPYCSRGCREEAAEEERRDAMQQALKDSHRSEEYDRWTTSQRRTLRQMAGY